MSDIERRTEPRDDVITFDTNAMIFLVLNSPRLSPRAHEAGVRTDSLRLVSAATLYEVTFKARIGKLPLDPNRFREALRAGGFVVRSITERTITTAATLEWANRDPWDRIIAATAMAEHAVLVSSDRAFDQLSEIDRIW